MQTFMLTFTEKHLVQEYADPWGCPIFCALKDAGVPVKGVASSHFTTGDHDIAIWFNPDLAAISRELVNTELQSDVLKARQHLVGRQIEVTY